MLQSRLRERTTCSAMVRDLRISSSALIWEFMVPLPPVSNSFRPAVPAPLLTWMVEVALYTGFIRKV